jgi:hypothetical protein
MDEPDWNEIIKNPDHYTTFYGCYYIPSNKIYISKKIKDEFEIFYRYLEKHEKRHYLNYNDSNKSWLRKIYEDIKNELNGNYTKYTNKKLKENIEKYNEKNKEKVFDLTSLMKMDGVYENDWRAEIYSMIVRYGTDFIMIFIPVGCILGVLFSVLYLFFV